MRPCTAASFASLVMDLFILPPPPHPLQSSVEVRRKEHQAGWQSHWFYSAVPYSNEEPGAGHGIFLSLNFHIHIMGIFSSYPVMLLDKTYLVILLDKTSKVTCEVMFKNVQYCICKSLLLFMGSVNVSWMNSCTPPTNTPSDAAASPQGPEGKVEDKASSFHWVFLVPLPM